MKKLCVSLLAAALLLQFSALSPAVQARPVAASAGTAAMAFVYDPDNIVVSYPDGHSQAFPASQPLMVTREMENALLSMPEGSQVRFTGGALKSKFIDLRNFDPTCFKYGSLPDGFELTAIVSSGLARTTFITLDGVPFYVQFVFVPNVPPSP